MERLVALLERTELEWFNPACAENDLPKLAEVVDEFYAGFFSSEGTGQVVEVCVRCFSERELPAGDS